MVLNICYIISFQKSLYWFKFPPEIQETASFAIVGPTGSNPTMTVKIHLSQISRVRSTARVPQEPVLRRLLVFLSQNYKL